MIGKGQPGPHQAARSSAHSRLTEALAQRAPRLLVRPEAALRLHWLPSQQKTDKARPSEDTVLLGQVGAQDFMTRMPPGLAVETGEMVMDTVATVPTAVTTQTVLRGQAAWGHML